MNDNEKEVFLTEEEAYLYNMGNYNRCYRKMGAHLTTCGNTKGAYFAVWAPNARQIWLTGSYNDWCREEYPLRRIGNTGIWDGFIAGISVGMVYKYQIETWDGEMLYKADPFAFQAEVPPATASVVCCLEDYQWQDWEWREKSRHQPPAARLGHQPLNIYEVHLGSWRKHPNGDFYTYRQMAEQLVPYAVAMGYTHLEFLPVMQHPYGGSWGYQLTGYYAADSRYGQPQDLMYLIDCCHQAGLGVILDWVPGHFCRDQHGLVCFDGTPLYERELHQQWGTYKFNFARTEVRGFLIGSALFWLDYFHADGLRVDGVTSMLYLDYGNRQGDQQREQLNGSEDPSAVGFLRQLNTTVADCFPQVLMIAEESTAWPLVTYPPEAGGLGFHYKWDLGWMNDVLRYCRADFWRRRDEHLLLTFSMIYAFSENFILSLSHDEVVHGKCSLIERMPGDYWQKFAGLRLLFCWQMCHPGAKLNFMGNEFGQFVEWRWQSELDWLLLDYPLHRQLKNFVRDLNVLYKREKCLWQEDNNWQGFKWLDADDNSQSMLLFCRLAGPDDVSADCLVTAINFQPVAYEKFRIGVLQPGDYSEIINSDSLDYGGTGFVNSWPVAAQQIPLHGQQWSIEIRIAALSGCLLKKIN